MKASDPIRRASGLAVLVFVAMLLTGCVGVIPLPASRTSVRDGHRLSPEEVAFIQSGYTTRTEVISQLGTNYLSLPQERAIAYSWEMKGGGGVWWFIIVTPYGGLADGGTWVGGWRAYFVAFDENDLVTAAAFRSPSPRVSLHEHLEAWLFTLPTRDEVASSWEAHEPP